MQSSIGTKPSVEQLCLKYCEIEMVENQNPYNSQIEVTDYEGVHEIYQIIEALELTHQKEQLWLMMVC